MFNGRTEPKKVVYECMSVLLLFFGAQSQHNQKSDFVQIFTKRVF